MNARLTSILATARLVGYVPGVPDSQGALRRAGYILARRAVFRHAIAAILRFPKGS